MKKAFFSLMVALLALSACAPRPETSILPTVTPTLSSEPSQEETATPTTSSVEEPLLVAFSKGGDIHLWDSEVKESRVIVKAGDITSVMMSDDGQVIAFLRRSLVDQPELVEYVSLWAVDSDGKNPRELVSAGSLRQRLNPPASDSTGFAQIDWIPGTHRLVYSGMEFFAPGQGYTNSKDIYVVDADTGADAVLAPDVMPDTFINAWSFEISPDGLRLALFSSTELSFINVDGSNWRRAVLACPAVGMGDAVLLPRGVWTEDASAFVFTAPMESDSPFVLNYTIWRVPADGSPVQSLATITDSHSSSVTFSPDGQRMAFLQDINGDGLIEADDYRIMPLAAGAGPLAIPLSLELFYGNVHWSPAGTAFVIKDHDLLQLCPDATRSSEICGDPILLESDSDIMNWIQWIDSTRFLFTGIDPSTLSLGSLDGTILPIVTWTVNDALPGWSFSIVRVGQ